MRWQTCLFSLSMIEANWMVNNKVEMNLHVLFGWLLDG